MPTDTFLRLPKEKQIKILSAAKKEFSRAPINKARISNIILDANISRGSFYQYFESIDELFIYLLKYIYNNEQKRLKHFYLQTNDIFEAFKQRFVNDLNRYDNPNNINFNNNAIKSLYIYGNRDIYGIFISALEVKESIETYQLKQIFIKNEYLEDSIDFISFSSYKIICKYVEKLITKDEAIKEFNERIDFLKNALISLKQCGY